MVKLNVLLGAILLALPLSSGSAAASGGRIHGTVVSTGGETFTGDIRWGDSEAFWDDLFNAQRMDLPLLEDAPPEVRTRTVGGVNLLGLRLGTRQEKPVRAFVARFGDIRRIRIEGARHASLEMKDGNTYRVSRSANDVGTDVVVGGDDTRIVLSWEKILRVDLHAPEEAAPGTERLWARVQTEAPRGRSFEGFLLWSLRETLPRDRLEGGVDDGITVSTAFGSVRSIQKLSRSQARVELEDGRVFELRGRAVDARNRGIVVANPPEGRVEVPWELFGEAVISARAAGSPSYGEYPSAEPLRGEVVYGGGEQAAGRLAFDLRASFDWEQLVAERDGVTHHIPFREIRSLVREESEILLGLSGGADLRVDPRRDLGDDNLGLVVYRDGAKPQYIPWNRVERVNFEPSAPARD